ncbi:MULTISPECIES: alpha/beta hydrolase [unclassified Psychrobacillus]|uniref:alpha/beta hydrolase n=1 Tax=unclassified Psychrobacillus TaxID=2636677 RepID=UPI00146F752B|nr:MULTISPECIES: alpha/beta hydrolase [unclassified Psychrobacillus]MCM3358876.1 alpha/beta hydrolase [Psychrobacillus sp. MER TA 171]NME07100.1 alpha/beta hydrolase [Psychrobacillus sp. BL-248-WT-3]
MRKRVIVWTSIFTSIISAVATIFGFFLTNKLMYMKKKEDDFIYNRELTSKRFDEAWYTAVNKLERWIPSKNGYSLKAIFIEPLETSNYVIICHGVTENKINSLRFVRMFERLGFNSVVYDHRRHGDSGGKTTSFGYYEKMDLQAIVEAVRERAGENAVIGIHGESMGAATTLLYAGSIVDDADFYISDCAFSNFEEQVYHIMTQTTPLRSSLAIRFANFFLKFRDGYTLNLVSPIDVVDKIEKPVLFIHSLEDDFILPKMTEDLYEKKRGPKMLKLFDIGAHAKSFNENSKEYEEIVSDFLKQYDLLGEENPIQTFTNN